jgi:hypothetical protein
MDEEMEREDLEDTERAANRSRGRRLYDGEEEGEEEVDGVSKTTTTTTTRRS